MIMEYLNNFRKLKIIKLGINIKKHIILCRQVTLMIVYKVNFFEN